MSLPKISVATLSFNQARFLEQALLSVTGQDYPSIQYIVVDPGSTDGSREILKRHEDRIDLAILERDDGPADGLNRALAQADGEYFAYLNSDDAFLPGAFLRAVESFAANPKADVVYGNGFVIDGEGAVQRRFVSDKFSIRQSVLGSAVVMQQASFFRLDAVKRVGGFATENRTCWDAELLLDIALSGGGLVRVWQDWGLFRIHDSSISGQGTNIGPYLEDCARQFQKVHGRRPDRHLKRRQIVARLRKHLFDPKRSGALMIDRLLDRKHFYT